MRTFDKGNIAEAAWVSFFTRCGDVVLLPFGGGARYDLAVDRGNGLERVQVKTARRRGEVLRIPTCSVMPDRSQSKRYTAEEIDLLAAYWPEEDRYFLIAVDDLPATEINLRLNPAKNGQQAGIRDALAYEVVPIPKISLSARRAHVGFEHSPRKGEDAGSIPVTGSAASAATLDG